MSAKSPTDTTTPTKQKSPTSPLPVLYQILIVLFTMGVAFLILRFTHPPAAPEAEATPPVFQNGFFQVPKLQWESLTTGEVRRISFPIQDQTDGTVAADDGATTSVFSPFTGRVTDVYVKSGDVVRAGQPLFAGEATEYAQAQNDLSSALATLKAAQVQLSTTTENHERLLRLKKLNGAAEKDVDQSTADLAAARTAVKNDEVAVALVQSRFHILNQSPKGNDKPAAGALPSRIVVSAPISGVVTLRGVGVGQFVESAASGSTVQAFTIANFSRLFLVANVSETRIASMQVGNGLTVRLLSEPDHLVHAHVVYIAPTIDPTTHRIFVRAQIDNPDGNIKPGMYGTFWVSTAPAVESLAVPVNAVVYEDQNAHVWIVGKNRTLAVRQIRVGRTAGGLVQVLSGLNDGDRVVTSGSVFIDRAVSGGAQ